MMSVEGIQELAKHYNLFDEKTYDQFYDLIIIKLIVCFLIKQIVIISWMVIHTSMNISG